MNNHFYLSDSHRMHVLRHFHNSEIAGSHFYTSVFKNPEELLSFINKTEPIRTIPQNKNRKAYCFCTSDGQPVGTSGIALRSDLSPEQIVFEAREGFDMEIGTVDKLPETSEFCVVADSTSEGWEIITAFPGKYAPPFPQKHQDQIEYELSASFWKQHILLKKK